jgi:hypothetical protein
MKPHEETWTADADTVVGPDGAAVATFWATHADEASFLERTKLAAAAPDLVRALLAVEWSGDASASRCPGCLGVKPGVAAYTKYEGHSERCPVDAALRKAGAR